MVRVRLSAVRDKKEKNRIAVLIVRVTTTRERETITNNYYQLRTYRIIICGIVYTCFSYLLDLELFSHAVYVARSRFVTHVFTGFECYC